MANTFFHPAHGQTPGRLDSSEGDISNAVPVGEVIDVCSTRSRLSLHKGDSDNLENQASWELAEVAAQVAHDLRGPLSFLRVFVQMSDLDNPYKLLAADAVSRIEQLSEEILSRRRRESTMQDHADGEMSLLQIVEDLRLQKLYARSGAPNLFAIDAESLRPYQVRGLTLIRILSGVLDNLISNALEAICDPNAASLIRIFCRPPAAANSGWVELVVVDNGVGIADHLQGQLFCMGATFNKQGGHGVGLFSVKQRIEKLGGEVDLTSRLGQGTEVVLRLPHAVLR